MDRILLKCEHTDSETNGKTEQLVIKGKPEVLRDGIAHFKVHYIGAHITKYRKGVITWEPHAPKLSGLKIN